MNPPIRHAAIPLLFCIAILTIGVGCLSDPSPHAFSTSLDYKLLIISTEPLTNVTFYIPLPVKNGTPAAGSFVFTPGYFGQENISVDFVRSPPGMDPGWTGPLEDSAPWFLKITADRFYPNETYGTTYSFFIENRTLLNTPLAFPDTVYPVGNESVFLQKADFSPSSPETIASEDPDLIKYRPVEVNQNVMLYARYSANQTVWVHVYSQVIVINRWNHGWETEENFYCDSFGWFHTGEADSWQVVKGIFGAAEGEYPNLSRPAWQKVLSRGQEDP